MRRALVILWLLMLPALVIGLTIQAGKTVTLTWDSNTDDAVGYYVYDSHTAGGPYTKIGTVAQTASPTFTTDALANGTWYFVVTAYNTYGESGYSNEVSAVLSNAPNAPTNLKKK